MQPAAEPERGLRGPERAWLPPEEPVDMERFIARYSAVRTQPIAVPERQVSLDLPCLTFSLSTRSPIFPGCGRKARCAAWLFPMKTFRKETRKCFWIRIWKSWSRISDTLGTDTAQRTACRRASGPTLFQGSFRFHLPNFFRKRNSHVDPAPCSQPAPLTGWLCRLLQAVRYVNHIMFFSFSCNYVSIF